MKKSTVQAGFAQTGLEFRPSHSSARARPGSRFSAYCHRWVSEGGEAPHAVLVRIRKRTCQSHDCRARQIVVCSMAVPRPLAPESPAAGKSFTGACALLKGNHILPGRWAPPRTLCPGFPSWCHAVPRAQEQTSLSILSHPRTKPAGAQCTQQQNIH